MQHAGGPRRPKQAPQQQQHGSSAMSSVISSIGKQDYRREDLVRMADAEFQRKLRDARSIEDLWEVQHPCKCAVTTGGLRACLQSTMTGRQHCCLLHCARNAELPVGPAFCAYAAASAGRQAAGASRHCCPAPDAVCMACCC